MVSLSASAGGPRSQALKLWGINLHTSRLSQVEDRRNEARLVRDAGLVKRCEELLSSQKVVLFRL